MTDLQNEGRKIGRSRANLIVANIIEQERQQSFAELLMPPPSAALAEQPVAPTDEELDQLEEMLWDRYKTLGFQGEEFMYEHSFGFALADFARAVLARWGQP
jgi:hypothetical protein